MSTIVLKPNNYDEITTIMSKKFRPKLKTEDDSIYFNNNIDEQRMNYELRSENNTFNQMSSLFPSISIEVSKINILYNFFIIEN